MGSVSTRILIDLAFLDPDPLLFAVALGDICNFLRHSKHLNNEINNIIVIYDIPSKNTYGTNDFFYLILFFFLRQLR